MNEPGVIQMTASAHAGRCEDVVDLCRKHMILRSDTFPSDEQQDAYIAGVREGWRFATYAILRDGNTRFEKE